MKQCWYLLANVCVDDRHLLRRGWFFLVVSISQFLELVYRQRYKCEFVFFVDFCFYKYNFFLLEKLKPIQYNSVHFSATKLISIVYFSLFLSLNNWFTVFIHTYGQLVVVVFTSPLLGEMLTKPKPLYSMIFFSHLFLMSSK